MNKIFFTITGTCYRYGHEFIEPGMTVRIIKEPDNEFDKEAIELQRRPSLRQDRGYRRGQGYVCAA